MPVKQKSIRYDFEPSDAQLRATYDHHARSFKTSFDRLMNDPLLRRCLRRTTICCLQRGCHG